METRTLFFIERPCPHFRKFVLGHNTEAHLSTRANLIRADSLDAQGTGAEASSTNNIMPATTNVRLPSLPKYALARHALEPVKSQRNGNSNSLTAVPQGLNELPDCT